MKPNIPITRHALEQKLEQLNLLSTSVGQAITLCEALHAAQTTKDGAPFIEHHLYPVAYLFMDVLSPKCTERAVIIALLHDVLEDCKAVSKADIEDQFGDDIAQAVEILTRDKQDPNYTAASYIDRIRMADAEVRLVKLADRVINLELVQRIKATNPDKYKDYLDETKSLFLPLAKCTSGDFYDFLARKLSLNDIKVIITDFSRVLRFPTDDSYDGGPNALNKKLLSEDENYDFSAHFKLNAELLDYYRELNQRIPVHIFTSESIQDHPAIKQTVQSSVTSVLSALDLGVSKTDPAAYAKLANKLAVDPSHIVYIDDKQANLDAADTTGMQTLLYLGNKTTMQALDELNQK